MNATINSITFNFAQGHTYMHPSLDAEFDGAIRALICKAESSSWITARGNVGLIESMDAIISEMDEDIQGDDSFFDSVVFDTVIDGVPRILTFNSYYNASFMYDALAGFNYFSTGIEEAFKNLEGQFTE